MFIYNTGDLGKDQIVTTTLSGGLNGTAFTTVNNVSNAIRFNGNRSIHGGGSYRFQYTALANNPYLSWDLSPALGSAFIRFYYFQDTNTDVANKLVQFYAGTSNRCGFQVNTDGTITIADAVNGSVSTTTNPLALGQWNRIEFWIDWESGASGTDAELRLYLGESDTPYETLIPPGFLANGSSADEFRFGKIFSTSSTHTFWIDTIAITDVDWLGPANSGTVLTPNTGHLSRPGNIALGVIEAFEDAGSGTEFVKAGLGIIGP